MRTDLVITQATNENMFVAKNCVLARNKFHQAFKMTIAAISFELFDICKSNVHLRTKMIRCKERGQRSDF